MIMQFLSSKSMPKVRLIRFNKIGITNFHSGKKVFAPLQWRRCMPLLIAEFSMIWYLIFDIPAEHSAGNVKYNKCVLEEY